MENTARVKAQFTSCTTKGSTVIQFELDSDCKSDGSLAKLIGMVRHMVTLDITDEQMTLDLGADEQADGQMEAFSEEDVEELEIEEEDELEEAPGEDATEEYEPVILELPEPEDELEEAPDGEL